MIKRIGSLGIASLAVLLGDAAARGVTPYLPLNLDPEIERQVERVLVLGDKPVMTRPIPAALVLEALPQACKVDAVLCESVRSYLKRYMRRSGIEFGSIQASASSGSDPVMPDEHGRTTQSHYQIAGAGYIQPSDYLNGEPRWHRVPGTNGAYWLCSEPRLRFCTARYRLSRPLVVTHDGQFHAPQHGSADNAVHHTDKLRATDPSWLAV